MAGTSNDGFSLAAESDPLVGSVLSGRYDVLQLLGQGAMGRVYEGRQRALDRPVAIKCIHRHLLATEELVVRFLEEARVASQLVHPNIVKIYDFGRSEGTHAPTLFLVMELLQGPRLGSVIAREGPLPLARVYSIAMQLLSALGEAHAHGVTHRDAKPDNVILEPVSGRAERVKVIDFGVAKVHGAPGITAAGVYVGTPCYMPPEQLRGAAAEASSDLYAVGVTLFQMITGRLPFEAATPAGVLEQQLAAAPLDPRQLVGDACPEVLAAVCRRALHPDPRERYSTADAFAEALTRALPDVLPVKSLRHPYSTSPSDPAWPSSPPSASSAPTPRAPSVREPPRRESSRGGLRARVADLSVAEHIERTADAELRAGRPDGAAAELRRGLALGRCWIEAGDLEVGAAALTVFGRKLGTLAREAGRLEESERALRAALEHTEPEELGRARVLAELATTLADRGRIGDAESLRVEALRIAGSRDDRVLTGRLRRMAQSFAIAVATRRPVSDRPPSREDRELSRRSEPPRPGVEAGVGGSPAHRRR